MGSKVNNFKFWTTKPNNVIRYETVAFSHPDIDDVLLVANQYDAALLGGNTYIPARMEVKLPEQDKDPIASVSVSFPRAVVGEHFKQALKQISPFNRIVPISMEFSVWISSDVSVPQQSWNLFVGDDGILMTGDTIQVTGTDDNPMVYDVSTIYDPAIFTGLELI